MSNYYPATVRYLDAVGLSGILNAQQQPNEALALALVSQRADGPTLPPSIMDLWAHILSDQHQQARIIEIEFIRHARRLGWTWASIAKALELETSEVAEQRVAVLRDELKSAEQFRNARSREPHPGL